MFQDRVLQHPLGKNFGDTGVERCAKCQGISPCLVEEAREVSAQSFRLHYRFGICGHRHTHVTRRRSEKTRCGRVWSEWFEDV